MDVLRVRRLTKNIYNLEMTHKQLVNLAARWNKSGNQVTENSPKKIEIFDVNTKTASAKLTAEWGIDLFHLAKVNNQWKIVNVIWQSQPENE
ncbi:MAG: nuclear transport factor 2 family protein [Polaribacter sp.]